MLTQDRLKELMSYDPETGLFRWIKKPAPRANRVRVGAVAGCQEKAHGGYILIGISLGLHASKEQAHAAYREGALRHHGEFARFQ